MTDVWETVPRLLAEIKYLVLGTADEAGNPWTTPVYFAAADPRRLYWVSSPDSRHSRNIAVRPRVSIAVFDSTVPIGGAEATYLSATAGPAADDETDDALAVLNTRLPDGRHLDRDDLLPNGLLRIYRADVAEHFVLIGGGDTRFDNVIDMRLPVTPPE
jgi:pyridoxamine 5'-phosphate oxidase-like protein